MKITNPTPHIHAAPRVDRTFMTTAILLGILGTLMVFSAGYPYATAKYGDSLYFIKRQIVWLCAGIAVMLAASRINLAFYKRIAVPIYIGSLILLALTLIIGYAGNGAQRWISVGPLTVQPSEIAKLGVIMMLSWYFDKNGSRACTPKGGAESFAYGTLIPILLLVAPLLLVMLQHHLSCIIIISCIGILLIILAGIDVRYILSFIALGAGGVCALALFTDYTKDRITVWLDPEKYRLTGGWQTLQGLMAIGSGGLLGKGYGKGELKYCYVSEPANDMIFAILCEETGFVGAAAVMLLFGILIYKGFRIADRCGDSFRRMICLGICLQISIQTLLNIAVVTNTIPNTGISLPFFSYGGSSLIMMFFEVGILLSASRDATIER